VLSADTIYTILAKRKEAQIGEFEFGKYLFKYCGVEDKFSEESDKRTQERIDNEELKSLKREHFINDDGDIIPTEEKHYATIRILAYEYELFEEDVIQQILKLHQKNRIGEFRHKKIMYLYYDRNEKGVYEKSEENFKRTVSGELRFLETECYIDHEGNKYSGSPKSKIFIFPYKIL
jgi:hypothetical protein